VVLDAARACVLGVGVRRTTLTDVARRAGVSRMTVYRRWPDITSLVADLMTREFVAVAEATRPAAREGVAARDVLVDHLIAASTAMRANPVFRKVVDVDPELLLPYLLDRLGASQTTMLGLLEAYLAEGQADGSVRRGDRALLARALLLPVQSFVLSAQVYSDGGSEKTLAKELRRLLDAYLRPDR